MTQPFVDVVVLLWKCAPYMEALFEGLEHLNYPHDSVCIHFVNHEDHQTSLREVERQMEKRAGKLPPIKIHDPGANLGFAAGNNVIFEYAQKLGSPYVYLLNSDASFEPDSLLEAVRVAEEHPEAGSVQSLIVLQDDPTQLNTWGNAIHLFGFGYSIGWKDPRESAPQEPTRIAYGSGAGILYRMSALEKVGYLDADLFLYHEDLDLGWRLMLAGYDNYLAPKSVTQHRYEFSRSIAKWKWMERNRYIVMFKNFKIGTLLLLAPFLIVVDAAILLFAIPNGWWREKLQTYRELFTRQAFAHIREGRLKMKEIRVRRDRDIFSHFSPEITHQEVERWWMDSIAHPMLRVLHRFLLAVMVW